MNLKKSIFLTALLFSFFILSFSFAMEKDENLKKNGILVLQRSRILDLRNCSIDSDIACKLSEIIKGSPWIEQINLNNNKLGDKGIKNLAISLKNMKLTYLSLGDNAITDDGFCELFPVLKEINSLVSLDISGNKIGFKGINMLGELLNSNSKLTITTPALGKDLLLTILQK